jgi:D-glycero-D-manno-heptose 1,7-bisphosphate phosphatase
MPFIILDRDGVINFDSDHYIKNPDEWIAIPGSLEAIAQLNRAGYRVLVATNQSGVARGYYSLETLDEIHEKMQRELAEVGGHVEEIFFCPHHPDEKYQINLADTFFVGDNLSDVQVAKVVGCKPLLVMTGKGAQMLEKNPELKTVKSFSNLAEAVDYILNV